jgi:rhodanese-related sulfurtransferase
MKDDPLPSPAAARRGDFGKVFREGVVVAVVGAAFAFAANALSPRGLALTRNYFPGTGRSHAPAATAAMLGPAGMVTKTNAASPTELLAARLKAVGLQLAVSNQVTQLFRDPRYEQGLVVFVDARDDRHYGEGHVPGAWQFDHYRAENYLGAVLPVCLMAEQVVVYCNGGDCEDSEFAALTLNGAGIAKEKLFVYGGGMTEWMTNGLPVEVGVRKSGNLRPVKP